MTSTNHFKLRPYQLDAVAAVHAEWLRVRNVLLVMATGGGKTVCFASIIRDHIGASAAVAHRREIVSQIACSLAAEGVVHRVVAPAKTVTLIRRTQLKKFGRSFIDPTAQCGVVSVQTLTSKASQSNDGLQRWLKQVGLAVFDEGHHYVQDGFWARAIDLLSHARLLFVTATPQRADGKGLAAEANGFVQAVVEAPQSWELIRDGYLSSFKYLAPASDINVADIPLTAKGDFDAREFRKRVVASHLVGDVIKHYQAFGKGGRAIVFTSDVETAEEMAAAARTAGIAALALNGKSDQLTRDQGLEDFQSGKIRWLVNVDLFDEGFDVPAADVCILARLTDSLAKYLQMVGRVLRPVYADGYDLTTVAGRLAAIAAGPKPNAIVIDHVRNWERGHGLPDWPRVWSMLGRERGNRGPRDTIPMKICPGCTQPYEAFHLACPYCGEVIEPLHRSGPQHVDGDLFELDREALAAVFAAQQHAEMSDDEYRQDQLRRHIPAIGRPRDLRRHQAAQYRRKVLRGLVNTWVACQAGREMGEVHRRFYHRFGVDIGTAFTLNASDTDALAERIARLFTEDLR